MPDLPSYRNLIGGVLKSAGADAALDSLNPATGAVWARIPASGRDDVDEAVAAAKAAFPAWSSLPPAARRVYLETGRRAVRRLRRRARSISSRPTTAPRRRSARWRVGDAMVDFWKRKAHETLEASTGRTVPLDARHARLHATRAVRRRRRDRPVQHAGRDAQQQGRSRAGRRQHRRREAARAGQRRGVPAPRRAAERGLPPGTVNMVVGPRRRRRRARPASSTSTRSR